MIALHNKIRGWKEKLNWFYDGEPPAAESPFEAHQPRRKHRKQRAIILGVVFFIVAVLGAFGVWVNNGLEFIMPFPLFFFAIWIFPEGLELWDDEKRDK